MAINPLSIFGGKNPAAAVDEARKQVEQLHRARLDLDHQRITKSAQLAEEEAHVGANAYEAHLSGSADLSAMAGLLGRLRTEIDILDRMIDHARLSQEPAILAFYRAEAAAKLAEAGPIRQQAADRQRRTDKLLAELKAWEGCAYEPSQPPEPERAGGMVVTTSHDSHGREIWTAEPAIRGGAATVRTIIVSRTRLMEMEADAIERQATEMGRRQVVKNGQIDGSREELLAALERDPFRITPNLGAVVTWMAAGEAKERQRRAHDRNRLGAERAPADDAPFRYELSWRDGEIVAAQSHVGTAAAAELVPA